MISSYLSKTTIFFSLLGLLLLVVVFGFVPFFLGLIFWILTYIFFRKNNSNFRDNLPGGGTVCLSPINGKIIKIQSVEQHPFFGQDLVMVKMRQLFWGERGLYMPFTSQFEDFSSDSSNIKLRSVKNFLVGLHLGKAYILSLKKIWVTTGDRGKVGANFGFCPFGGTASFYFSSNVDIIGKKGDKVIAGLTPIAVNKKDCC